MSRVAIPGILAASRRRTLSYSAEVLADNPLLYLRLEETAGTTCANAGSLGGNGQTNGTVTRNVASHAGLGVAVTLGGLSSSYLSYPDNASLDITSGAFTFEAWVAITSFAGYNCVISKGTSGGSSAMYSWYIDTARKLTVWKTAVEADVGKSTGTYPNDSNWHHIAVTRTGSLYSFYIDGASAGTDNHSGTNYAANSLPVEVGRDGTGNPLVGSVDEPAIYGTALSSARILAHYNAAV